MHVIKLFSLMDFAGFYLYSVYSSKDPNLNKNKALSCLPSQISYKFQTDIVSKYKISSYDNGKKD